MSIPPDTAVSSALRRLLTPFSVEITPKEAAGLPPLSDVLDPGSAVYITFLPRTPWADTLATARWIAGAGLRPVPHLAARSVPDRPALRRMLADLAAAGVGDLLLVAGSTAPAGEFHETAQILSSGCLEEAGIVRVGVAGHPEGNAAIGDEGLAAALEAKNRIARERGLDVRIVTQFCFAAEPIVAWERAIRAAGNTLPIHVGLPGLTSPTRLLRFGLSCGVGPSLKVLRAQAGGVLRLATTPVYRPDETVAGLAAAVAADPASLLRGVHLFPFGSLVATARWAAAARDSPPGARPSVTA
jgi:methylenetetrahydrofolate reductase (NADPH)